MRGLALDKTTINSMAVDRIMVKTSRIAVRDVPIISNALRRVAPRDGFVFKQCPGIASTALALWCAACGHAPTVLTAFQTEQQAQTHCPKDSVVWLDPQSGLYHLKGQGSYGGSNAGRYACRAEADAAGMHAISK